MRGDLMTEIKEFGNYLKKLRKENGLTIRQLTEKSGVSNAYLSQLETGKRGLPKPEILAKLHGPLGVGYDELMEKAGYISSNVRTELLPETIQTMEAFDDLNELILNASDMFIKSVRNDKGELLNEFKEYLFGEFKRLYPDVSSEVLDEITQDPDIAQQLFEHLTIEEKISFLNIIIKGFSEQEINPEEVFKNAKIKSENSVSTLKVPLLGHIAAGQPIFAEDHIEEWTEIPNMWNVKQGEVIVLRVKGDSMIGSRIYEGDKVVVKLQPHVENGEIAVVNVNGNEATLKKVKRTENGQVILYPDNPKYDPIFVTNENARIIGKVIQVIFEPK
jgi:SOS regulatory protein LexA